MMYKNSQKSFTTLVSNTQDQERTTNFYVLLSSTVLAFGIFSASTTTQRHHDPLSSVGSGSNSNYYNNKQAGNGRRGSGGGGGGKRYSKVLASVVSQKDAEQDIRQVEQESIQNPYEISIEALQGPRWTMEDAYSVENGGRFVAVFDGHGGNQVSSMLREQLYNLYQSQLYKMHWIERNESEVANTIQQQRIPSITSQEGAIRGALEEIERRVSKMEDLLYQGSTSVAVLVHVNEKGERTLISANIGDSRAVLSRKGKAVELTRDHKPSDERERARIQAMGEEVEWDPYGQLYRVRDLSLSRAIGDFFAKPAVSSEAEIQNFPVSDEEDEFVVLASDGLWDVMSSQEVVDYIHQSLRGSGQDNEEYIDIQESKIARRVANEALERGSADNVCVLVLWLRQSTSNK